jgi:hypothetical protein
MVRSRRSEPPTRPAPTPGVGAHTADLGDVRSGSHADWPAQPWTCGLTENLNRTFQHFAGALPLRLLGVIAYSDTEAKAVVGHATAAG